MTDMFNFMKTEPMTTQTIIELLARREGWQFIQCGANSCTPEMWKVRSKNPNEMIVDRYVTREEAQLVWLPKYLSSLDALQPVLATLTKEEKNRLRNELYDVDVLNWDEYLTIKPELLATCIAKVIEKKEQI